MTGDSDGFLSRWSRTKRAGGVELAEPTETAPPAELDDRDDAEILQDLGLTDPDLLQPGDDFSAFLREAVPEHLRRRALRRLWRSNPVLANLDGLNDYDTDFTGDSVAPGLLQTAYRVGLGFVQDIADATEPSTADTAPSEKDVAADTATGDADPGEDFTAAAEDVTERQILQESDSPAPRRRMHFRFEA
ncbi:hypothetical protein RGUI_3712 [Rhodovulum sp. P5]|uniref:DUF3306 domain-containing protein n=1 Tax=Rhodovulum sp. P5 TaxID=1564506 RepID=UPI0009C274A2|nr:DUF3306 domain-containing protein [Rhodovulum sp. P5]ARE41853.1 hypothetical protein RGUI_3712 [Rhodovulum sp. P5]